MKILQSKIIVILIFEIGFSLYANAKYKLYVNVFKPIYCKDTVVFPTVNNYDSIEKAFKIFNLNVADAELSITDYKSQKKFPVLFDKRLNAYFIETEETYIDITVKRKGYLDQRRVYNGSEHDGLFIDSERSVKLVFYLFTGKETPLITGKAIFPFHPVKNQLAIKLVKEERDSTINNFITRLCIKYNLTELSNESEFYKMPKEQTDFLYHSYIILKKKNGNFTPTHCAELAEIRSQPWGELSGPVLGYYKQSQSKNIQLEFASHLVKVRTLSNPQMVMLSVKNTTNSGEYLAPKDTGLELITKMYLFHIAYPSNYIINRTW